jgi:peptidoglycan hydrolase-like protein with peptidoglycan-binding domain
MNNTRLPKVFRTKTWAEFLRLRLAMILRGLAVGVCLWLIAAPALAAFSKNEIRELEDFLTHLGFDPGPVDGVLDARTRTGIKDYQDFASLPVTGRASRGLLDELRGVTESLGAATFEIVLQLASFRSKVDARRGWAQVQRQLPDLLGDMNPRFPAVDLGEEGTYYRVVTGPFPNRATAADLCAMVRAEGQACLVTVRIAYMRRGGHI